MWALKVDISLLNQHCKPADWLADWLTDWLRRLCTQGTQALKHSRCSKGTLVPQHSGYLDTWCTWALKWHLGTWALQALRHVRHLATQKTLLHSDTQGTWALGHSGTWPLKVLEALYLADSFKKPYFYINKVRASFLIFNILTIKNFHDESCPQSCVFFSFILKVLWFVNIWSNSSPPFR